MQYKMPTQCLVRNICVLLLDVVHRQKMKLAELSF